MSFQAYLDAITAKTGLVAADFIDLARERGLLAPDVKAQTIVDWLAADYGLGRGHAMALVAVFKDARGERKPPADRIAAHFAGDKALWKPVVDQLISDLTARSLANAGPPIRLSATDSYLSVVAGKAKIAVFATTAKRLDVGIKLPGIPSTERLESAGSWNAMVTHRVRLSSASDADAELRGWLEQAREAASAGRE